MYVHVQHADPHICIRIALPFGWFEWSIVLGDTLSLAISRNTNVNMQTRLASLDFTTEQPSKCSFRGLKQHECNTSSVRICYIAVRAWYTVTLHHPSDTLFQNTAAILLSLLNRSERLRPTTRRETVHKRSSHTSGGFIHANERDWVPIERSFSPINHHDRAAMSEQDAASRIPGDPALKPRQRSTARSPLQSNQKRNTKDDLPPGNSRRNCCF